MAEATVKLSFIGHHRCKRRSSSCPGGELICIVNLKGSVGGNLDGHKPCSAPRWGSDCNRNEPYRTWNFVSLYILLAMKSSPPSLPLRAIQQLIREIEIFLFFPSPLPALSSFMECGRSFQEKLKWFITGVVGICQSARALWITLVGVEGECVNSNSNVSSLAVLSAHSRQLYLQASRNLHAALRFAFPFVSDCVSVHEIN